MKNLLLGLTLLTSISSFATPGDLDERGCHYGTTETKVELIVIKCNRLLKQADKDRRPVYDIASLCNEVDAMANALKENEIDAITDENKQIYHCHR